MTSCAYKSFTYGEEGKMSARPTECGHFEPQSLSQALSAEAVERDRKQDRSGRDRIQRDYLRGEGWCVRVPEETTCHRQSHRGAPRCGAPR